MRIVILGGAGMIGHKMWQRLSRRFPDTYVTLRKARADYPAVPLFDSSRVIEGVDAGDFPQTEGLLQQLRPDVIVNCVGVTPRRESAEDEVAMITVNSLLPHKLVRWSEAWGGRVIHFNTDCVFDGATGNYTEDSPPSAVDLYGRTKALGEVVEGNALTIRSSMIGREIDRGTELLEWFLGQRGRRIRGYRQALYTGVSTNFMAELVGDIIERFPGLTGLYQVASEVVSKYDLLLLARDAFRVDVEIEPDDTVVSKRNLNGDRFQQATGLACPTWVEMMADLAADPTPYEQWR